ncbi:MAG: hypothetical protein LBH00_07520 [Planctomycetaceae bacterium]|jgi:hypothetical protein|nr:hypothetical protein [Planctomycetaceae bacterium]
MIVQSGADLNIRSLDGTYAVIEAKLKANYEELLYLLESGACYDPSTLPGGELQRLFYAYYYKPDREHSSAPMPKEVVQVTNWLKARGVQFNKPVPPEESTKQPEPFRVNNKLLELRKKNAEKQKKPPN